MKKKFAAEDCLSMQRWIIHVDMDAFYVFFASEKCISLQRKN